MISIHVNGKNYQVDAPPEVPLLWVLREQLQLTGTKYSCGIGECGSCTVHIDGQAERACTIPIEDVNGSKIITIEGLAENHPVKRAWVLEQVPQCGYCQPGQMMQAAMLLGPPTDLFDMRRRLENGTYIPPFGLDQAFIALGFPDRVPLRYWRYSGAYHVRRDFPPLAILHSRSDQVVPYQQSELLTEQLSQVGATYEVHFFDGGSHYLLAEESDALAIFRISLAFLEKYIP